MLSLVVKATARCNSNCAYCPRDRSDRSEMSVDTVADIFRAVDEFLRARPDQTVEILWHGGEPLLRGPGFYLDVLEHQRRLCEATGDRVHHSMQTNLTLFGEPFVGAFRALGIESLGTSFDPEPHVRGPGRRRSTERHARRFLDAVTVLDREGIGFGVVYVVTRRSLDRPVDVLAFLTNLVPAGTINLNPVVLPEGLFPELDIGPSEYVAFLRVAFEWWFARRQRFPDVEPFSSILEALETGPTPADPDPSPWMGLVVLPNGSVTTTRAPLGGAPPTIGTIRESSLAALCESAPRRDPATEGRGGGCSGCRLVDLCRGGEAMDAFGHDAPLSAGSAWCRARLDFVEGCVEPAAGRRFVAADGEGHG